MESRTNWLLLLNAMLGSFLTGTAGRIFAISLPTVASGLETDFVGISWALISFQISTISLALVFGRLGDLYGRQTLFGAGFLVFAVSSFLCGIAQDIFQLILFRLFQGIGAAMTQSQARTLAMESVPEELAGRAQGFMTTAFHSGFLLGPSLGGLIIDYIHWRGIFFFLVPIALAGMSLTWINRRKNPGPPPRARPTSIDILGAVLLVGATVSLIAIVDRKVMEFLAPGQRALLLVAFLGLFLGFLTRERTAASPIINLSMFKIRMFTFSSLSLLLITITQVIATFLLPFYLQDILRLSPSFMGLLFMSAPIFTVTLSPVSGYISDRVGPRIPATAGAVLLMLSSVIGTMLRMDSHWMLPTSLLALWGLAIALFFPPNHAAMIGSVPGEHRGVATGTVYVMFGLGNTFGIAFGTLLMTTAFRSYTGLADATPTPAVPDAFVNAMNFTFLVNVIVGLAVVACSAMRGTSMRDMKK